MCTRLGEFDLLLGSDMARLSVPGAFVGQAQDAPSRERQLALRRQPPQRLLREPSLGTPGGRAAQAGRGVGEVRGAAVLAGGVRQRRVPDGRAATVLL